MRSWTTSYPFFLLVQFKLLPLDDIEKWELFTNELFLYLTNQMRVAMNFHFERERSVRAETYFSMLAWRSIH